MRHCLPRRRCTGRGLRGHEATPTAPIVRRSGTAAMCGALRVIVLAGIGVVLLGVMAANYMPAVGPIRLPGELGKLVIKGTKITMQAPQAHRLHQRFPPLRVHRGHREPGHQQARSGGAAASARPAADGGQEHGGNDRAVGPLRHEGRQAGARRGHRARLLHRLCGAAQTRPSSTCTPAMWCRTSRSGKLLNGFLNAKRMEITENGAVIRFDGGVSMELHPDQDTDKAKTPMTRRLLSLWL